MLALTFICFMFPGLLALAVCVDTMLENLRAILFRFGVDKIEKT